MFFLRYQTLRLVGLFYYKTVRGQALLPDYTAEALAGGFEFFCGGVSTKLYGGWDFYYKTVREREGTLYQTTLRRPPGVRLRILCAGERKERGTSAPPHTHTHTHSFTTRLHGGERQNNRLLRCLLPPLFVSYSLQVTRSSYSVERAMEVLLQDYTGARRASYQTVRRLFFLFSTTRLHGGQQPTNQPDDDGWCCCCFFSSRKQIF